MAGREQLVRRWQEGLAQNESEFLHGPTQRRWIKRIYVRVYRFLLAVYGGADWTTDATGPAVSDDELNSDEFNSDEPRGEPMPLVDLRQQEGGQPPKSVAQIRRTLKTVHAAGESLAVGPQTSGLGPEDWIVAASQRDGVDTARFAGVLRLREIPYRRRGRGSEAVVEVRYVNHEEALDVLQILGSRARLTRGYCCAGWLKWSGAILGAWFGGMIGGTCPLILMGVLLGPAASELTVELTLASAAGMFIGGLLGALAGGLYRIPRE
jgi:hypothetical protein